MVKIYHFNQHYFSKPTLENFLWANNFAHSFFPAPNHPYGEGDIIAINRKKL